MIHKRKRTLVLELKAIALSVYCWAFIRNLYVLG